MVVTCGGGGGSGGHFSTRGTTRAQPTRNLPEPVSRFFPRPDAGPENFFPPTRSGPNRKLAATHTHTHSVAKYFRARPSSPPSSPSLRGRATVANISDCRRKCVCRKITTIFAAAVAAVALDVRGAAVAQLLGGGVGRHVDARGRTFEDAAGASDRGATCAGAPHLSCRATTASAVEHVRN